jgi:nucleoid DNA-binding protein
MNPKKPNKLYNDIAEELNISNSLVEDIMQFYYKEIRYNLINLKYTRLNAEGLGHFMIKPKVVKSSIQRLEKVVKNHDTSTYKAYHNKKAMEEKLQLLTEIEVEIDKEYQEKQNIKTKQNESSSKSNLGE